MRRRAVSDLSSVVAAALETLGRSVPHQVASNSALISNRTTIAAAQAARALAGRSYFCQPSCPAAATTYTNVGASSTVRGFSSSSAEPDPADVQLDEASPRLAGTSNVQVAAGGRVEYIAASAIPGYVETKLDYGVISGEDLTPIIEQLIDLHFIEAEEDIRHPNTLANTMRELIHVCLGGSSPLRRDGEVVSRLLWGAYRLDLELDQAERKVLLAAVERSLASCNSNGVDIAHTLCALGGLGLHPSLEYLESVGARLSTEGIAANMALDYLILALQGCTLLGDVPTIIIQSLLPELVKKASADELAADELGRIARLLPFLPKSSESREALAEQVYSQAAVNAPFMDLFAVNLVLRCAAKMGSKLDPALLVQLAHRAKIQLGTEGAFAVAGTLLWALGKQGCMLGDGAASEKFVKACVDIHLEHIQDLQKGTLQIPFRVPLRGSPVSQVLIDFLEGCGMLGVGVSSEVLGVYTDLIERPGEFHFHEEELRKLMGLFEDLGHMPGVYACKGQLGI